MRRTIKGRITVEAPMADERIGWGAPVIHLLPFFQAGQSVLHDGAAEQDLLPHSASDTCIGGRGSSTATNLRCAFVSYRKSKGDVRAIASTCSFSGPGTRQAIEAQLTAVPGAEEIGHRRHARWMRLHRTPEHGLALQSRSEPTGAEDSFPAIAS